MKWSSPEFRALQRAWYERLAAEGFDDIEEIVNGKLVLKQSAAHPYRGADELSRESKAQYYCFMADKVQREQFDSIVDWVIIFAHAHGKKIKHICKKLEILGIARARDTVRYRIRIYEMKWGLRSYTPRQLHRTG